MSTLVLPKVYNDYQLKAQYFDSSSNIIEERIKKLFKYIIYVAMSKLFWI